MNKEAILKERGNFCESCTYHKNRHGAEGLELHHCLFHRKKGQPQLDSKYNIAVVCQECHPYCNGHKFRVEFWDNQVKRYGKEVLREWLGSLKKIVIEDWIWEAVK